MARHLRPLLVAAALSSALIGTAHAQAQPPACTSAPIKETIYLRGGMNGWVPAPEYAFTWQCDAYVLAVELQGMQDFKVADAAWTPSLSLGGIADTGLVAGPGALSVAYAAAGGNRNLSYRFDGEHVLRYTPGPAPGLTIASRPADASAKPAVADPVAASIRHDSRDTRHKSPFGAVPAGTDVAFAIDAQPGVTAVTLVLDNRRLEGNQEVLEYTELSRHKLARSTAASGLEQWRTTVKFPQIGVFGYWFEVTTATGTFVYQNNNSPIYWTRERGAGGLGAIAPMPTDAKTIRRFRHTVYSPDFTVPGWARDAVYYYIFPERFRNGDPGNDVVVGRDTYQDKGVEVHARWTARPYRPGSGDGSDDVASNDFFGGDLAGIIEKLDYIRDLGANTIYMTPIFQAASNHKYDTADYQTVDSRFGSNADFQRLTSEAAKRDIRVIVDVSFNHTGRDSPYFDRYGKYDTLGALERGEVRADSPYADWYRLDPKGKTPEDRYVGWTGAKDLPELNEASESFRRFVFGSPGGVTQQWLDLGASGWRMDVAPWVPDDFWRPWRKAVKAHNPDALTIAETWFDSSKYFLGDTFDTTMNYIFRNAVLDFAGGGNAAANYRNIEMMRELYPPQSFYALMNLLSTHDAARALHVLGDHDQGGKGRAEALRRYELALLFQMTFPGAPAIYYGDEVGLGGGDDPDNRRPYPWADKGGTPDQGFLVSVKSLTALRQNYPILRHGTLSAPLHLDREAIVLLRRLGGEVALVVMSNATVPKTVTVSLPADLAGTQWRDLLGRTELRRQGGQLTITVPALSGSVLINR